MVVAMRSMWPLVKPMQAKIDWVSFSLPLETDILSPDDLFQVADFKLQALGSGWYEQAKRRGICEHVNGRAPYRFALASADGGLRIFGGGPTETILYEFSGRGCDGMDDYAATSRLLSRVAERITRLDYAVDVRTGALPSDVSNACDTGHFRSISQIKSDTGETVYLGSPKSDRFSRIYRYNPPHPRHELIRLEFVFRRALAKSASQHYVNAGSWASFTALCGNTWGITHPIWQPEVETDERLTTESRSKASDKTVHWLYKQVAPALRRLIREDAISIADFLEHVYNNGQ